MSEAEGLLLRLSPDHSAFEVALPSGVSVRIGAEPLAATLRRLLLAQKSALLAEADARERAAAEGRTLGITEHWQRFGVSTLPSPTEQRLWHEARHTQAPAVGCPFCRDEGRAPKPLRVASTTRRNLGGGAAVRIPKRELSPEDLI